jgi:ABC-2 type transport system permease protein
MQVFKAYFKVMRGAVATLSINLCVFLALAVLFSFIAPQVQPVGFEPSRIPVAIINRDKEGEVSQGLAEYMEKVCKVIECPDDPEKLQDALFHGQVKYVAIIPPGFSDAFLSGEDCVIQKVIVPGSAEGYYVDIIINRFLDTLDLYRMYGGVGEEDSLPRLIASAMEDLAVETPVTMIGETVISEEYRPGYYYYFLYCAYALLALITMGVSTIMISFNEPDLYMRNSCSPLSKRRMNLQLAAGHTTFALGCWAVLMIGSLVMHGRNLSETGVLGLYSLNTLAFTFVCAAIGLVIGAFVRSTSAQSGVVNVVALGLCFLGGVFVPQSIMSESVLAVSKFLPSYWFVKANDAIAVLRNSNPEHLHSIHNSILIQVGFAIAIFSVALFFSKEREA